MTAETQPMNAGRPSIEELKKTVRSMDPRLPEASSEFEAALVLLAGLSVGSRNLARLARFTGVPYPTVLKLAQRLRLNGIWTRAGHTIANWLDEHGEIAFWADVNVALGHLQLTQKRKATYP